MPVPYKQLHTGLIPHLIRNFLCLILRRRLQRCLDSFGQLLIIVPFFGDQQFWGGIVGVARAGPMPVPYKQLTVEKQALPQWYPHHHDE
jgi:hypothetical protein